jgi:hypothetical protein
MTAQTTPRYGFALTLMVAAMVAIAIAGSVWAKGSSQPMVSDDLGMDVGIMMAGIDTTKLPAEYFADPF